MHIQYCNGQCSKLVESAISVGTLRVLSHQDSPGDLVRLGRECRKISQLHWVWCIFTLHFWKWTKPPEYCHAVTTAARLGQYRPRCPKLPQITRKEKSMRKKKTCLIDLPGLGIHPLWPACLQQKQTMEQHQIYAVFCFHFKPNCFFTRSCPVRTAGEAASYPACCSVHETNETVWKKDGGQQETTTCCCGPSTPNRCEESAVPCCGAFITVPTFGKTKNPCSAVVERYTGRHSSVCFGQCHI